MTFLKPELFGLFKRRTLDTFKHLIAKFPWHDSVKSVKVLVGLLTRSLSVLVGSVGKSNALAVLSFARLCRYLWSTQGHNGLVKYLKAAQICLMKAVAGQALVDTRAVGGRVSRTLSGVPRCIPPAHRELIRLRDRKILRLWMTLFGLYRVLEVPFPVVSLKTIYTPGVYFGSLENNIYSFIPQFLSLLGHTFSLSGTLKQGPSWKLKWLLNVASGPLSVKLDDYPDVSERGSFETLVAQAEALVMTPFWSVFDRFLEVLDHYELRDFILRASWAASYVYPDTKNFRTGKWGRPYPWVVGKLALKVEPAGKVRVFAIVDYFTQVVLKPLHDFLFEILRAIPQDGTFDQHKPLHALVAKGHQNCYSFDLSAATDRLPLSLQENLLSHMLSPKIARAWADLFRLRDFKVPSDSTLKFLKVRKASREVWGDSVRYAVGQPMGALSSWAMLALTHHYIVQLAAHKAGFKDWFTEYAILGDDVVICDPSVAGMYLELMSNLGVPLNLSKSVVCRNSTTMEFAKRFIVDGVDVSAVPLREVAAAANSLPALAELFKDGATNKMSSALASMLKFMGKGYRVMSRICSNWDLQSRRVAWLQVYMRSPWGLWPMVPSVWFTAQNVNSSVSRITETTDQLLIWKFMDDLVNPTFENWYLPVISHVHGVDNEGKIIFSSLHNIRAGKLLPDELDSFERTIREMLSDLENNLEGNFYLRNEEADNLRSQAALYESGDLRGIDNFFALIWNAFLKFKKVPVRVYLHSPEDEVRLPEVGSWLRWYYSTRSLLKSVMPVQYDSDRMLEIYEESPRVPYRQPRFTDGSEFPYAPYGPYEQLSKKDDHRDIQAPGRTITVNPDGIERTVSLDSPRFPSYIMKELTDRERKELNPTVNPSTGPNHSNPFEGQKDVPPFITISDGNAEKYVPTDNPYWWPAINWYLAKKKQKEAPSVTTSNPVKPPLHPGLPVRWPDGFTVFVPFSTETSDPNKVWTLTDILKWHKLDRYEFRSRVNEGWTYRGY